MQHFRLVISDVNVKYGQGEEDWSKLRHDVCLDIVVRAKDEGDKNIMLNTIRQWLDVGPFIGNWVAGGVEVEEVKISV